MNRWDVADAVVDSTLTPIERLMMLVLVKRADTETAEIPEQFSPSLGLLARETGLARSTVAKTLNSLEAKRWVDRWRPTKRAQLDEHARTRYVLMPCVPREASPGDGLEVVREPDQASAGHGPGWSDDRMGVVRGSDTITPRSSSSSDLHDTPSAKNGLIHYEPNYNEDERDDDPWSTVTIPQQSGTLGSVMDEFFGIDPRSRERRSGFAIACPACAASPGEPCWDDWSDGRSSTMHPNRIRAASEAF